MNYRIAFTLGDAPAIITAEAVSIGAAVYDFYQQHPGAQLLTIDPQDDPQPLPGSGVNRAPGLDCAAVTISEKTTGPERLP